MLLSLCVGGAAWAERARGAGTRAKQIITKLEDDKQALQLAKEPVQNAKEALDRAGDARKAGDNEGAERLEGLALEWAETGQDVQRAAEAEAKLDEVLQELREVETKTVRARALLEETSARRARARSKLKQLEEKAAQQKSQAPEATGGKP